MSPTRRVALGQAHLPAGYGPLLLGCVAGWYAIGQDEDFFRGADELLDRVRRRVPVAQPHLRYRFQVDLVGLSRSVHSLRRGQSGQLEFVSVAKTHAATPHVLAAIYAAGQLTEDAEDAELREPSCDQIREALLWARGKRHLRDVGRDELLAHLMLEVPSANGVADANGRRSNAAGWDWALGVLEFTPDEAARVTPRQIENRYRKMLKAAHPDKGGCAQNAPTAIANLSKARQILTR